MFDTKDTPELDVLQIEADARRMRAEFFATAIASLKTKITALIQSATHGKAQA